MILELPGVASDFADLPLGNFFMFQRMKPEFGLCVSVGHNKSAIIFSYSEQHHAPLWLAVGGLPHDPLVSLPQAIVRSDLSSVSQDDKQSSTGAIISAGGEFYIRARQHMGSSFSFNMRTGEMEQPRKDAAAIAFSDWQVGLLIGDQFDPIFKFQSVNPRQ